MDAVADDARRFINGITSRYFADVVRALRDELTVSNPAQLAALDALCMRLGTMRDLLEQRLNKLAAEEAETQAVEHLGADYQPLEPSAEGARLPS